MPSEPFSKRSDGISSIKTIKNRFNTKGRITRPIGFYTRLPAIFFFFVEIYGSISIFQ
ncbi:hypothetical protein [Neisseria meningitidis]|uniref:hypothetical protein n=1 Tax=Neisseria meningitidis TaxID=487 RepID=UPI000681B74C|nr:hypothetical protein [Neisseria meningitidis]MBW3905057.1 hypothetical protein [Neisseria meningitidis]